MDPRTLRITPTVGTGRQVAARLAVPTGTAPVAGWAGLAGRLDRNRLAGTVKVPGGLGTTAGSVLVAGGMVLVSDPGNGAVQVVGGDRLAESGFETAGRDLVVDERGTVWVHSEQRVVGFGPEYTRGRTLEEAGGAIRALAAGRDALWVGAPARLLRVDFRGLP